MKRFDYVLVGGGLQNGLIALALRERQPQSRVAIVETSDRLGGNHTWSFHAADVPAAAAELIRPLVVASWQGYEVRFPGHARTMPSRYSTVSSERFDAVVRPAIQGQGWLLRLNSPAATVGPDLVRLESGEEIAGRCVIDSRGPRHQPAGCGYQKFFGLEVETDGPWPEALPAVMDATVAQTDGFHFLYTLPLAPNRVLVEDTYFSGTAALDHAGSRRQVERHLRERVGGWRVVREEAGVLPMPWAAPEPSSDGPLLGGYAGGWIHPATGYSFPVALRLALALASAPAGYARQAAESLARRLRPRCGFARFLNWLLFKLVPPDARWQVFARLYRDLPAGLLARFYAMEFSTADAARVLIGRPPQIDLLRPLRRLWSAR
ncbi:MAG: lycopene beta-cyclase CrtY [Gemmataceae bacterium]